MGEKQNIFCAADPETFMGFYWCFWETNLHFIYAALQRMLRGLLLTPLPLHCFSVQSLLRKAALTHVLFIHICRKRQIYCRKKQIYISEKVKWQMPGKGTDCRIGIKLLRNGPASLLTRLISSEAFHPLSPNKHQRNIKWRSLLPGSRQTKEMEQKTNKREVEQTHWGLQKAPKPLPQE